MALSVGTRESQKDGIHIIFSQIVSVDANQDGAQGKIVRSESQSSIHCSVPT